MQKTNLERSAFLNVYRAALLPVIIYNVHIEKILLMQYHCKLYFSTQGSFIRITVTYITNYIFNSSIGYRLPLAVAVQKNVDWKRIKKHKEPIWYAAVLIS